MTEPRPLANIRILDFCWMIAGPLTTRMFANFGAEVIRVESANRVDRIREGGPMPKEGSSIDNAGVFNDCNTGKLSITLNLNHPKARDIALKLAKISDLVTNNFTGDRMDRWGLGYQDLVKVKPDIIMMTMPTMGAAGPYQRYGAYGNGVIAVGGLNWISGFPQRPPVGLGPLYSDFSAPYHAATVLLAALHYRNRTGRGQFIDLGQYQATVSLLGPTILDYTVNGTVTSRSGNRSPDACPHGAYRCLGEDRWCAVAVETDDQWRRLCKAIGHPELAEDPRFATLPSRKSHEDEVDAIVESWTSERSDVEAMEHLQAAGVPAGSVQDIRDMVDNDPHLRDRHYERVPHPDGFEFTTHGEPIKFVGKPNPARRAPLMGEHNDYVFRTLLGLSDEEVTGLVIGNVLY